MDVDCIVPGHGAITNKEGVRQLRDYWRFLDGEVRERYSAGMPAQKAAYDIARCPAFAQSPFARWDSPERMLVNVHTLYRWLQGRTDQPKLVERLRIFAQEAEFACAFPTATPASLHQVSHH
jgi:hypothetical protein